MANNVNNNENVNNNVSDDNNSVEANSSPSSNTNVSNNSGAKNNSFLNNIGLFGNRRNGYGSGIGNIFGRNKKNSSPMRNGSNSYQNRIAQNRERLNRARAERNNPYKRNTGNKNNNGTDDNNQSGATGSTAGDAKEKGILDKAKDNLNVLGAGASLAGSHMDNLRNKASTARHPLKAAKGVVANKIKMTIMTWISGIAIGCAPYLLGIFVAIIVVLFVLGLLGNDSSGNMLSQAGVCSYNVDGKSVSDIKVRLLNCEGDTPVEGEELIDFETYITGVVYQETGDSSYEALKAQAVAARSYALKRPGIMGGEYGVTLEEEDGQWILSLRSCTNDQVFCHPDKGCWSNRRGGQTSNSNPADWPNCTVHSGEDTSKTWHRGPLAEDSDVRKAVEETRGEVLVDDDGKIVNTDFLDTNQQYWDSLAKQGKDYLEILVADYGDQGAARTSSNCTASSSTINDADINTLINLSQEEAWEQLIGKRDSGSHPSISRADMDARVTEITVPIRTWKSGGGHNLRTDTVKKDKTITVNKAMASLWQAFFTDVYNEATDFVINDDLYCYSYRSVTGGGSLSAHAYGVACDINASVLGNGYGDTSLSKSRWEDLPETRSKYQVVYKGSKIIEIAHKYTLINGSDWKDPHDAMHFSFIRDTSRSFAQSCQGKISCSS